MHFAISPAWNLWPPSVPAVFHWCWSCRSDLSHSRWCSGPRWTRRWPGAAERDPEPPEPEGGLLWWCGPDMGPLPKQNAGFWIGSGLSMVWEQVISIGGQTFGATDDQAKFRTHWHTHDFLVVARQDSSRRRVVSFKVRHTTKQMSLTWNINPKILNHMVARRGSFWCSPINAVSEPHVCSQWGRSELSCKCSNAYWSSKHLISPHVSHDWWWPGGEVSEGSFTAAKHKYCLNYCAAVALLQTANG